MIAAIMDKMPKQKIQKPDPEYKSEIEISNKIWRTLLREPDYQFEILGALISKKNNYVPNGKSFFKPQKVKNAEQMVWLQIPDEVRDLKLENPDIVIECHIPKKSWRSDRDNGYTFLQDMLVKAGVLSDDSINHCNGFIILIPVAEASEYKTKVRIWKNA
jgi:Holliday junction resolvase RusA-like endonuclease